MVPGTLRQRARRAGLSKLAAAVALALSGGVALPQPAAAQAGYAAIIERIKPSIVAVGTFSALRNPQFRFSGTGFAVGNGSYIATNEHVVAMVLDAAQKEVLAVAIRAEAGKVQVRSARKAASDASVDLALLGIEGPPLSALRLGDSAAAREGELLLFTGFPIGTVLGLFPVTHRTMISAVTPIAIPAIRADKLDAATVRRISAGPFAVFQLDGTAYPGNSGSPVYRPESGEVIGILNSTLIKKSRESALSQPSGISYAIPAERLKALLDTAR